VRREACPFAFRTIEARAGERQKLALCARQPRQIPAAAHVRKQADARFRHGEAGVLGRDAEAARAGEMPTPPPMVMPSMKATTGLA
jgi:hypothetical protein